MMAGPRRLRKRPRRATLAPRKETAMAAEPTPDTTLASDLFAALREATFDGVGITRDAYGPGERAAHAIVRQQAAALGLETAVDAAGNLLMTLPGADRAAPVVVIGSHLDSVRQGGNYDGAAGVLAGLVTLSGMVKAGFRPRRDITVLAVRAEEAVPVPAPAIA
jgi:N-carbamoyl-L-amino-acid hydrolase